jgi:hypothetical protein
MKEKPLKHIKREENKYAVFINLFLVLIAAFAGCLLGNSMDNATDPATGKIVFSEMVMPEINKDLFSRIQVEDTNTQLFTYICGGIAILALLYRYSNRKRYHRRGEEHGSSRWGTNAEKRKIADKGILLPGKKIIIKWFLIIPFPVRTEKRVPFKMVELLDFSQP